MRFSLSLIGFIAMIAAHIPGEWIKETKYLCDRSISFSIQVNQSSNPFSDAEIISISYQSDVVVIFQNSNLKKSISEVHSDLIYQCALCAPRKLLGGNDTLSFNLSEIFELPSKVKGKLYLQFHWGETLNDLEKDRISCIKSRVFQFELQK